MNIMFFLFIAAKVAPLAWNAWAIGPLIIGFIGFMLLKFLNY
jgi:hypothetical protein